VTKREWTRMAVAFVVIGMVGALVIIHRTGSLWGGCAALLVAGGLGVACAWLAGEPQKMEAGQ
jgi:hypothetical protein